MSNNTGDIPNSERLFNRAQELIPGGVNSPVRAFGSVGGTPRFIKRGQGAYIFDEDEHKYIDYVLSWGPLILGHAHPNVVNALNQTITLGTSFGAPTKQENQLAELVIETVPSIDQIRFVNSGTEACMSAIRLARAHTGRDKIIKFTGNYHGHADLLLVQAGSGVATLGLPDSPGVPKHTTMDTLTVEYNDIEGVRSAFEKYPDDIAGVIMEPIAANMGFVLPETNFLQEVIEICNKYNAVSILDEVMTGFRVAPGGAQERFDLDPDITTLGKVIGGGLPVGAYAGKEEIMAEVAPRGNMYQAGTLSGNPLAMTAGLTTITTLLEDNLFATIEQNTSKLVDGIRQLGAEHNIPVQANSVGTMFGSYFLKEEDMMITNYTTAKRYADTNRFTSYFHKMLQNGVYLAPSPFEAGFVSSEHSAEIIEETLTTIDSVMNEL